MQMRGACYTRVRGFHVSQQVAARHMNLRDLQRKLSMRTLKYFQDWNVYARQYSKKWLDKHFSKVIPSKYTPLSCAWLWSHCSGAVRLLLSRAQPRRIALHERVLEQTPGSRFVLSGGTNPNRIPIDSQGFPLSFGDVQMHPSVSMA